MVSFVIVMLPLSCLNSEMTLIPLDRGRSVLYINVELRKVTCLFSVKQHKSQWISLYASL